MDKNQNDDNGMEDLLDQMQQIPDDYEPDERYFEIDEFSNALDSLKKAHLFLSNFDDSYRWKWVSSSLLNALYGLMVCALRGSNYERVIDFRKMDKKSKSRMKELSKSSSTKDYLESLEIKNKFLDSHKAILISFQEALERIQKKQNLMQHKYISPIEISERETANILGLKNDFRNQFEHYRPLTWMINQQVFIPLLRDTMSVIKKLLNDFDLKIHHSSRLNFAKLLCSWIDRLITENEEKLNEFGH